MKIKKSGLSTALSDRAKPIPKIVARASEVFPYGNLGCTRHNWNLIALALCFAKNLHSALLGPRFLSRGNYPMKIAKL